MKHSKISRSHSHCTAQPYLPSIGVEPITWMGHVISCNRSCFVRGLVSSWIKPVTNRISLSSVSWAKGETPRESVCEWSLVLSSPAKQIIPICTATVFVTTFSPSHLHCNLLLLTESVWVRRQRYLNCPLLGLFWKGLLALVYYPHSTPYYSPFTLSHFS